MQTNTLTSPETIWVWPVMAHLFSHLQVSPDSPISLVFSQLGPQSQPEYIAVCVSLTVFIVPATVSIQISPGAGL